MNAIDNDVIWETIQSLQVDTQALRVILEQIRTENAEVRKMVDYHNQVLVRGNGDNLPLAEIVRGLTKTVTSYIERKDKEEIKTKEQWDKFKWIFISFLVPSFLIFVFQATVFIFKIYPILEKLRQ